MGDYSRYPYTAKIMPTENNLPVVILDILIKYNWSYVMIISGQGANGENGAKVCDIYINAELSV